MLTVADFLSLTKAPVSYEFANYGDHSTIPLHIMETAFDSVERVGDHYTIFLPDHTTVRVLFF